MTSAGTKHAGQAAGKGARTMTKGKDLRRTAAAPPPLDMTAPGKDRHIEVTISKQATDSMREIGGSEYEVWNNSLLHRTMMAAPPTVGSDGQPLENYSAGLAGLALRGFAPKDPVEAMIASQAVALHFASLECSRRAMLPGQPADMASRLRKDAANSARAMIDMAEALDRRRGKGPQTIRVERVVVQDGGQAVVAGTVVTGGTLAAQGRAPAALEQASGRWSRSRATPSWWREPADER